MTTYYIHYLNYREDGLHFGTDVVTPDETKNIFNADVLDLHRRDLSPDNPVCNYAKEYGDIRLRKDVALATGETPAVWSLDLHAGTIASAYTMTIEPERNDALLQKTIEQRVAEKINDLKYDVRDWERHKKALSVRKTPTETVFIHTMMLRPDGFSTNRESVLANVTSDGYVQHARFMTIPTASGRRKQKLNHHRLKYPLGSATVHIDNARRGDEALRIVVASYDPALDDDTYRRHYIRLVEYAETLLRERHAPANDRPLTARYYHAFEAMCRTGYHILAGTDDPLIICDKIGHHYETYAIPTSPFGGTNEVEQAGTCIRCKHETHDRGYDTYV